MRAGADSTWKTAGLEARIGRADDHGWSSPSQDHQLNLHSNEGKAAE